MKYQPPKGTQDLWGKKFYSYDFIAQTILKTTERYGFRQIRTPGFEPIELLAKNAGSEITSQIYAFEDKGGRSFGIKSDITPAVARFIAGNSRPIPKPIKVTCYDRIYRYERPQTGRNREITQVNAELFGAKEGLVEAELLACFYQCYVDLGLPEVVVELGFRPLLEEYVRQLQIADEQVMPVIRLIDKKDKIGQEQFNKEIFSCGITQEGLEKIEQFISLQGNLQPTLKKAKLVLKGNDSLLKYVKVLDQLASDLKLFNIDSKCRLNLGLARGFEYYTGIIFEAKAEGSSFGSIGGGGRYDDLVSQYGGPQTPAVGFSIGLDRVCLVLQEFDKLKEIEQPEIDYYLVAERDSLSMSLMIKISQNLREKGKNVELDLLAKNMSGQLQSAKELGAKKAILFKKVELADNKLVILNLRTDEEKKINIEELGES